MDVSSAFQHSQSVFSPDSQYVLSVTGDRLVLRVASTLQLHRTWRCVPDKHLDSSATCSLAFSPCSRRLLACFEAINTVFAFAIDQEEEIARITAGVEGCKGASWISETHVAVWSEHGLRITIWSLATGASHVIKWPAHGPDRGWALRPTDQRFLALAEKPEGRNGIGIYDGQQDWRLVRHFAISTHDVRGLLWSPCGRYLAVWDDPLDFALYVYTPDGRQIASLLPYSGESAAQTASLGIRSVSWHPSGDFLAVAGFDGRIRLLNDLTWTSVAEMVPTSKVSGKATAIFQEPQDWIARTHGKGIIPYESLNTPRTLPSIQADPGNLKVQIGISMMRWSPSGTLLACVSASMPNVAHIFTFAGASHTLTRRTQADVVIIHDHPVSSLEWLPLVEREMLVIASGVGGVTLWNAAASEVAEGMGVPSTSSFLVRTVDWSTDGTQLMLTTPQAFAVAYLIDE